jgi:hypothetical protein
VAQVHCRVVAGLWLPSEPVIGSKTGRVPEPGNITHFVVSSLEIVFPNATVSVRSKVDSNVNYSQTGRHTA